MKILEALKAEVLSHIQPTEAENKKINHLYLTLKEALEKFANSLGVSPKFINNQGSTGLKQTHLRGTSDLDIFIGLDPQKYSDIIELPNKPRKKSLKDLFLSYTQDWFSPAAKFAGYQTMQISYAEHPYLTISHEGYDIDIVGCFDLDYEYLLKHGPITAVDRTPWHSKIIAEKLSDTQKEDVRLLKAFLQANYVYGDKATLGRLGFTGFSAEVMILLFNDIENLFNNFQKLENNPLDFFERPPTKLRKNKRFINDFLIIIDPVDRNRNLASSISERAYRYALYQIKNFQNDPSMDYFMKKSLKVPSRPILSKYKPNLVVVEFRSDGSLHYTEIRDRLYSACEKVRKLLEKENTGDPRFGETIFEIYFEENNFSAVFFCENSQISPIYLRKGPPSSRTTNSNQFRIKHPDAVKKNGHYYAPIKRKYQKPIVLISHFFQNYKSIEGLTLNTITQEAFSVVGQRAMALMIFCVLPLSKVMVP